MSDENMRAANMMDEAARKIIYAVMAQAEIEACKAENQARASRGESPAYGEDHFIKISHDLRERMFL